MKALGQHFLKDPEKAALIADAVVCGPECSAVLEIGPGSGMLTQYLLERFGDKLWAVEYDPRFAKMLAERFPNLVPRLVEADFTQLHLGKLFESEQFVITGNFPYQISTEIIFRMIDYRAQVPQLVGMFQREVADRIAAGPGSRTYGITSVLVQAFYDAEVLFYLPPELFSPPPKVHSAVLKLERRTVPRIQSEYKAFAGVVKTAFNQRRKTLRNALKPLLADKVLPETIAGLRAEALSVEDFDILTKLLRP